MENGKIEEKKQKALDKLYNTADRYGVTRKTLYSIVSIFITIILLFAMAFTQAGFDTTKLEQVSYWVRFAILCGLSIWGMINGQQIGEDTARNKPTGAFRMTLVRYGNICLDLDKAKMTAFFEDWLYVYRVRKLKKKIESILTDHNINQFAVLDLDITEIENLKKSYKKEWKGTEFEGKYKDDVTYFKAYTDEQIEIIKYCLEGKVKVAELPTSFFLSVYQQSSKDMWESAANANKKKVLFVSSNYTFKSMLMLTSSVLLNGLVTGWASGFDIKTALLDFASEVAQVFMGVVLGLFLGYNIVKIDLTYLDFKVTILKQYKDDLDAKIFVPKSIEEQAQEAYEAEAAKNSSAVQVEETKGE